jgi:hypothetical protein
MPAQFLDRRRIPEPGPAHPRELVWIEPVSLGFHPLQVTLGFHISKVPIGLSFQIHACSE